MSNNEVIFDLTNENYNYRGVLFAEVDNSKMDDWGMKIPQKFAAAILAIIWTDEKGTWHMKMRLKFPESGNKQVFTRNYEKQMASGIKMNETYILNDIYKTMPMINKIWTPNPSEKGWGIVEIMQKLDMIEHSQMEMLDENN